MINGELETQRAHGANFPALWHLSPHLVSKGKKQVCTLDKPWLASFEQTRQLLKRSKTSIANGKNRTSGPDHTPWYHITAPWLHLFPGSPHPHSVPTSLTLTKGRRHARELKWMRNSLFLSYLLPLNQEMVFSKSGPMGTHIRISWCLVNIHPTSVPTKCLG